MNKAIRFIEKNSLSVLVTCGVIIFIIYLFFPASLEIFDSIRIIGCAILGIVAIYQSRNNWTIQRYLDKNKNLTAEDVQNILFVKEWEATRERGLWSYCIKDGGIILGAGLALLISAFAFLLIPGIQPYLMDSPGNMFSFIGYTYLGGFMVGALSRRVLWPHKERRFINLTDPLNDKHLEELFQDQDQKHHDKI